MGEIKIPEPKYATKRVHIDTITIPDDNEVVVRYRGRLFVYGSAVCDPLPSKLRRKLAYDPTLPVHAVCDVWGR